MSKPRDDRLAELFRPALEAIIDLGHPLVRLAAEIDWDFVATHFGAAYRPGVSRLPILTGGQSPCRSTYIRQPGRDRSVQVTLDDDRFHRSP